MPNNFPKPIVDLGEADLPLEGAKAYLSQISTKKVIDISFRAE